MTKKLTDAIAARDLALAALKIHGSWRRGEHRSFGATVGPLEIMLSTPFSFDRTEEIPPSIRYEMALQGKEAMAYGLDIWLLEPNPGARHPRCTKVLNIEWGDEGRVLLVSYRRRGEWEHLLAESRAA